MREQSSSNITHTHKVFRGGETKVMKKSLLSLLIFALVFTMAAPAFAATGAAVNLSDISNSYAKEEIEALVEAGIIGGYADGTFKPANSITRAEFAKILALVLELEEDAAAASVFTDVPAWAKGYVGALVNAELTQGVTATTYGSNQNISREQLATFFVRAWDLEEAAEEVNLTPKFNDADKVAPYAKANVALAGEIEFIKGLPNGNFDPKGNAQRQAVARLAYEFYANSEEYLAAAEDVINAAKPTLEVTDVKATNLKEVFVEFNQDVNEGSVADANFTVKDKDGVTVETTATLSEDGKTVVLTVKDTEDVVSLKNQTKYTLTVEKVKSNSDIAVEKTEKEFTAFDRELPEVEKVVVTGPKSFDIIFSEPIKGDDSDAGTAVEVKNENTTIGVNHSFDGFGTRTVSVELYSDMVDGKTYEVLIRNFEDYAGYKNVATNYELAYEKDETAPVAEVIKAEQEYVVVKFNKPVNGLTPDHFYHSFSAWKAVGIYKKADPKEENAISTSDKVSTVYVYFYEVDEETGKELEGNRPLPEGKVTFVAKNKVGSNEVKDNWGNKFEEKVFELNIASDKGTPDVQEITVRSERVLRVTFNKGVRFDASNVEVLNTDGSRISGVHEVVTPVSGSTSTYDINLGTDLPGKTVLVKITDVEDRTLAGNKLSTYTETITITDKKAPVVSEVLFDKDPAKRTLYVVYNEAVNSTAIVKGNYNFIEKGSNDRDKLVAFTGTASYHNDNKAVKLVFTKDQWEEFDIKDGKVVSTFESLQVSNVEDISGNKLLGQIIPINQFKNVEEFAPAVKSVRATATDKLVITFNQFLPTVDRGAFKVNSEDPAAISLSTNDSGETVATLTTKSADSAKFKHDLNGASYKIEVGTTNNRIKNNFGESLVGYIDSEGNLQKTSVVTQADLAITDKIAPVVDKVYVALEGDTNRGKEIQVHFTEALKDLNFAPGGFNGFSITGGTLDEMSFDKNNPTVVVLKGKDFTVNTRVHYNGTNVTDAKDNKLAKFDYTKKLETTIPSKPDLVADAKKELQAEINKAYAEVGRAAAKEGENLGDYIKGSVAKLSAAITTAENALNNDSLDVEGVEAATKTLSAAISKLLNSKVVAIAGLKDESVEEGQEATVTVALADGEKLTASSANEELVKAEVTAEGVKITGVAVATGVKVTLTVEDADGNVIKVGEFNVNVTEAQ